MSKEKWNGKTFQVRNFGHELEVAAFKGVCMMQGKDYRTELLKFMNSTVKRHERKKTNA